LKRVFLRGEHGDQLSNPETKNQNAKNHLEGRDFKVKKPLVCAVVGKRERLKKPAPGNLRAKKQQVGFSEERTKLAWE